MTANDSIHRCLSSVIAFGFSINLLIAHASCQAEAPPVTALAFDPAETELLAGSQRGVQRYSWPELKAGKNIQTQLAQIHDIAFSSDGASLAIAGGIPGESGVIEVWSWPKAQKQSTHRLHADVIYQFVWTADSTRLFTASHDGEVLEVHAITGEILRRFTGHSQPVRTLCLLEDQSMLLTAGHDQTIRVWSTSTGKLVRSLHNHTKEVLAIAQKPALKADSVPIVASVGKDGTVRLWQPTIGRMMRFTRLASSAGLTLAWSHKAEALYVTDDAGKIHSLDPDTLEIRHTTPGRSSQPLSLIITKDAKTALVGGSNHTLQKWPLSHE